MRKQVTGPYPKRRSMVKGYKYNAPITFDEYGNLASGQFPADCIESCSAQGSVDEAVEYWVKRLAFDPPRKLVESYLKEYGAWGDLQEADDEILARRVLWTAMCDIREQGEWFGLMR